MCRKTAHNVVYAFSVPRYPNISILTHSCHWPLSIPLENIRKPEVF